MRRASANVDYTPQSFQSMSFTPHVRLTEADDGAILATKCNPSTSVAKPKLPVE